MRLSVYGVWCVWCLGSFIGSVESNSLGEPSICNARDSRIWEAMSWATAPTYNTAALAATLRSGDGEDPSKDPTVYTPGKLVYIHIRSTIKGQKYRGLLLHAKAENGTKVGSWELPPEYLVIFHTPSGPCEGRTVMHRSAELKNYHHVFPFRAPPSGTGRIYFEALLKYGPANTGAFLFANDDETKMLSLTEKVNVPTQKWFEGSAGQSCTQTCAALPGNLQCDEGSMDTLTTTAKLEKAISVEFACKLPILTSCSNTSPSNGQDSWCRYRPKSCKGTAVPSCAGISTDARFCPCVASEAELLTVGDWAEQSDQGEEREEREEDKWSESLDEVGGQADEPKGEKVATCKQFSGDRASCIANHCYYAAEEGMSVCHASKNPIFG